MGAPAKHGIGSKFGKLELIERLSGDVWRCLCECGNVVEPFAGDVRRGSIVSCGCEQLRPGRKANSNNKPGDVFGALTLLQYLEGSRWLCRCECKKLKEVLTCKLNNGSVTSCGCGINRMRKRKPAAKLPPPPIVLDKKFGKLRVEEYRGGGWWWCVCACGMGLSVNAASLRTGKATSCGTHNCTHKNKKRVKPLDPMEYLFKRS